MGRIIELNDKITSVLKLKSKIKADSITLDSKRYSEALNSFILKRVNELETIKNKIIRSELH